MSYHLLRYAPGRAFSNEFEHVLNYVDISNQMMEHVQANIAVVSVPISQRGDTMSQISSVENVQPLFNKWICDQIKITPAAHRQLKALLGAEDEDEVLGLRIFVAGGGCSGMTYGMTFATDRYEHDALLEQDGIEIYVDAVALSFLEGVEIDYQEQPAGASFVFRNVFQAVGGAATCTGCGRAQV